MDDIRKALRLKHLRLPQTIPTSSDILYKLIFSPRIMHENVMLNEVFSKRFFYENEIALNCLTPAGHCFYVLYLILF